MADSDKPKTGKHHVTNVTDGPKLLNAMPPVILQAGASTDGQVEMTEAEYTSAKNTEWFKFGTAKAADKD